jgi:cytochrome c553
MPEKIPAVPQTWVAEQELTIGADGEELRDDHTQHALSSYRRSLVEQRNIQWVSGAGVGGYDRDTSLIMTQNLIPEDLPGCAEEGCALTAEITDDDSLVLSCKVGGFATKRAADDQEAACAACHETAGNELVGKIMAVNSYVQSTKQDIQRENSRHAETTRRLKSKLRELL